MDVTHAPLHGRTPYLKHRPVLPGRVVLGAAAPVDRSVAGGGGGALPELGGVPDGPDVVLPSGLRIRRLRLGRLRVGMEQLRQAIMGAQLLPVAHQQLVARLGIPIELVPVAQLERLPQTTLPVVGATRIVGDPGRVRPERLRIAAYADQVRGSVAEATQHEIGHVVAVVAAQDTSEATAERYANSY